MPPGLWQALSDKRKGQGDIFGQRRAAVIVLHTSQNYQRGWEFNSQSPLCADRAFNLFRQHFAHRWHTGVKRARRCMPFGTLAPHLLCLDFNGQGRVECLLSTIYKWYILHLNAQKLMNSHKGPYPAEIFIVIMSLSVSVLNLRTGRPYYSGSMRVAAFGLDSKQKEWGRRRAGEEGSYKDRYV